MAMYFGGTKVNFNLGSHKLNPEFFSTIVSMEKEFIGVKLLSSDNYILKDSTGVYITAKKEDK